MKNKILAGALCAASLIGTMAPVSAENEVELQYNVEETSADVLFHLDTTSIAYDKDNLTQDINYKIVVTTAGNYYNDNATAKALPYTVTVEDTELVDVHDSTGENKLNVTFNDEDDNGTLDLTVATTVETPSASGAVISTSEEATKAGEYEGNATVVFTADVAGALTSNVNNGD